MDAIRNRSKDEILYCKFCGHTHGKGSCPAYGKIYNRCAWKNHFEKNADKAQTGLVYLRVRTPDLISRNLPIDVRYMKLMKVVKVMTTLELKILWSRSNHFIIRESLKWISKMRA